MLQVLLGEILNVTSNRTIRVLPDITLMILRKRIWNESYELVSRLKTSKLSGVCNSSVH